MKLIFLAFIISFYRILVWLCLLIYPANSAKKDSSRNSKELVFFAAFYPNNAGYHYRVKLWADEFKKTGWSVKIHPIFSEAEFLEFNSKNHWKLYALPVIRRFNQIFSSRSSQVVIVRRDLLLFNDYGNLFLDKLLLHFHPSAILDFDDDIAYAKNEPTSIGLFGKILGEHPTKFTSSLNLYTRFVLGSDFLKEYLLRVNLSVKEKDVVIIPTCVDYDNQSPKTSFRDNPIRFGWIGGTGNLRLLDIVSPALEQLSKEIALELFVISGVEYKPDVSYPVINRSWSMQTQIEDIKSIDIGLMPLYNTKEDQGKCGFKLIQYMGLGIPAVASAVAVNKEIVDDHENGWLVEPDGDWLPVLRDAASNPKKLPEMGQAAREKITKYYSFKSNANNYLQFIDRDKD
jgi:glycosyltransferase involved in cell wall biosynthesis